MKRSIKILSLFLILVLMNISLAACQNSNETNSTSKESEKKVEEKAEEKVKEKVTLKFGHIYAPDHPFAKGIDELAKKVSEKTDGGFTIEVFPAGQLGNEKDLSDAIVNGIVDLAYVGPGELGKRYSPVSVFDAPFLFADYDHAAKVINGDIGKEVWDGLLEKTGIKALGAVYYGTRHVTSNFPVNTPEDLKGKKLRAPDMPLPVATVKAMGAEPTPMAFSEVYLALQQGVVDGQENPIATIYTQKFYEVQDYVNLTGHTTCFTPIVVSQENLDKLPSEYKTVLEESVKEIMPMVDNEILNYEKEKLKDMEANGVKIIKPKVEEFRKRAASVAKEFEEKWGKGLYEKMQSAK